MTSGLEIKQTFCILTTLHSTLTTGNKPTEHQINTLALLTATEKTTLSD